MNDYLYSKQYFVVYKRLDAKHTLEKIATFFYDNCMVSNDHVLYHLIIYVCKNMTKCISFEVMNGRDWHLRKGIIWIRWIHYMRADHNTNGLISSCQLWPFTLMAIHCSCFWHLQCTPTQYTVHMQSILPTGTPSPLSFGGSLFEWTKRHSIYSICIVFWIWLI